jgi:SAM-dependent methyltransferase
VSDVQDPEAALYDHVVQLVRGHARMLSDQRRNAAFYAALQEQLRPGMRVLDIGSGTGLWAIAAATLGADKAVAVERDPLLAGLITALARENGVSDRVEVISGDSRQVQLPREFDAVISETIGNIGFDEQILDIMVDARERFLKPGGILIPAALSLRAAPVCVPGLPRPALQGVPLLYDNFDKLSGHIPVGVGAGESVRLRGPAAELARVEFARATREIVLTGLPASWPEQDWADLDGVAVWAVSALSPSVVLDNSETSSWSPVLYRVRPFRTGRGTLSFELDLTGKTNAWRVRLENGGTEEVQSWSPALAAAALLAQVRAGGSGSIPDLAGMLSQEHRS